MMILQLMETKIAKIFIGGWKNTGTRLIVELLLDKNYEISPNRNMFHDYGGIKFANTFNKSYLNKNIKPIIELMKKESLNKVDYVFKHGNIVLISNEIIEEIPNSKMVICIRDPWDMLTKGSRNYRTYKPKGSKKFRRRSPLRTRIEIIKSWYESLDRLDKDRHLIVKLEDLVGRNKHKTVDEIYDFAGITDTTLNKNIIGLPSKTIGLGRAIIKKRRDYTRKTRDNIQNFRKKLNY